jgi:regulator of protease activity HflC (stomatin/prohibitin superfamily)
MLDFKKIGILVFAFLALITAMVLIPNLYETNSAGYYQVKQAWLSGDLTVRNTPGTYWQGLGKIETYQLAATLDFTGGSQGQGGEDSGHGQETDDGTAYIDSPFAVTFQGNSTATVSGVIKVRMPTDPTKQLNLHNLYRNESAVVSTLLRQTVGEAVKLAGPMFTSEEARTTKREEYTSLVLDMIQNGIYETYNTIETVKDEDGNIRNNTVTRLRLDKNSQPIVKKPSPLKDFGVSVLQFTLRGLDFDKVTQELMMAKKQAEQEKILARAQAEKAKQDAITEIEKGKATVAKAQAEENEKKIRQVVKAQADFESAQYQKKQANEVAQAKILEGEAEARVARLKVQAGLTPKERAEIDKEKAIGIARELSKVQFPASMVVVGGEGGKGGKVDPFTALGLNSMYDMTKRMEAENKAVVKRVVSEEAKSEE